VDRGDRQSLAAFFCADEALQPGVTISLGDHVARHLRARRVGAGSQVSLVDGLGHRAHGRLVKLGTSAASVEIDEVLAHLPPPSVHMLVPIADRDRMLWLGEKVVELGITSWRPVLWRRSRSVKPRGEGMTFQGRLRARMIAALEQCGGTWLPQLHPDATLERALTALPDGLRLVLDPAADTTMTAIESFAAPITLAIGPEGGLEPSELAQLAAAHFQPVRLGGNMLRFETAAVAALAIVRSLLDVPTPASIDGVHVSLLPDR
jgi:16S rRNA (uracil1498-N3)-methyltransferase